MEEIELNNYNNKKTRKLNKTYSNFSTIQKNHTNHKIYLFINIAVTYLQEDSLNLYYFF